MQRRFPIRTLHCLPELKEGGLERGVVEKAIWLQAHGVGAVVASAGGIWLERLTRVGIQHITLPIHRKNPFTILACARALRELIREEEIHLVCAHSRVPAWAAHLATRRGSRHEPPLVIEAQGYYERFWYSHVMCWGERIIAVSGAIRESMIDLGADPERVVVVPRGFSSVHFPHPAPDARGRLREEWGVPMDAPLIAGVGRLTHTKGWDDLIDALALMPKPAPYCVLVGSAHGRRRVYAQKLKRMVEELGLGDRVQFVGHRDDIPDVYIAADCIAAPSRLPEPFGRVVTEALVYGRPVVTTFGCGAAEFLGDDFDHFLVPPGDPPALAGRLSAVLADPDGTTARVQALAEWIRSELTVDRQMSATVDAYRECCPDLEWPS